MLLYLVRHGESLANKNRFHHTPATPLSKDGIKQAEIVAKRLKGIDIDLIYSSPQIRARQTAQAISKIKKMPIEFWDNLKEVGVPSEVWGKSLDDRDVMKIDKKSVRNFLDNKRFSDEETFDELNLRGQHVLDHLSKKHRDDNVVCVTHSTMTKMIVAKIILGRRLTPKLFTDLRNKLLVANTGITICGYSENYGWTLNTWNDRSHL